MDIYKHWQQRASLKNTLLLAELGPPLLRHLGGWPGSTQGELFIGNLLDEVKHLCTSTALLCNGRPRASNQQGPTKADSEPYLNQGARHLPLEHLKAKAVSIAGLDETDGVLEDLGLHKLARILAIWGHSKRPSPAHKHFGYGTGARPYVAAFLGERPSTATQSLSRQLPPWNFRSRQTYRPSSAEWQRGVVESQPLVGCLA